MSQREAYRKHTYFIIFESFHLHSMRFLRGWLVIKSRSNFRKLEYSLLPKSQRVFVLNLLLAEDSQAQSKDLLEWMK